MAKTTAQQSVLASVSVAVGTPQVSGWFATNQGVTGVCKITNGGTGPTVGADFVIEVADDNGGTHAQEWSRQTQASLTALAVNSIPFGLAIGAGADAPYYRVKVMNNTGQAVMAEVYANSTLTLV